MVTALAGTATGNAHGITKVRYTHDAMIDIILAQPAISQGSLAVMFGFSEGWVSRVMGSDAFQARLAERKEEIVNPEILQTFEQRLQGLANQSLQVIQKKLDATGNPDLAVKALELSTKALGMGARPQNVQTTNNYVVALPPKVENEQAWADGNLKRLTPAPVVTDVSAKPSAPSAP
jgi:uncharacterized protein (DUF3084 family)